MIIESLFLLVKNGTRDFSIILVVKAPKKSIFINLRQVKHEIANTKYFLVENLIYIIRVMVLVVNLWINE